jgi:hypothetical protein
MANIEPPSGALPPTNYALKVAPNKTLKLSVYETSYGFTLFIGGHSKFCVEALIPKSESVGLLSQVHTHLSCSLEHDFRKGIDTKMAIKLLCSFIHNNYPWIKELSLNDTSYKDCDHIYRVNLYEIMYITTGKTWYEKNFGATLRGGDLKTFRERDRQFQLKKQTIPFDTLVFYHFRNKLPAIDRHELEGWYNGSNTWQEFFNKIVDRIGIADFCIFAAPWLNAFVANTMRYYFTSGMYYIIIDDSMLLPYEQSRYQRGSGRRFTRKNLVTA